MYITRMAFVDALLFCAGPLCFLCVIFAFFKQRLTWIQAAVVIVATVIVADVLTAAGRNEGLPIPPRPLSRCCCCWYGQGL